MLKREGYKPIIHSSEYNRANEPVWNNLVEEKHLHYPDMEDAYDKFSKLFKLERDNFILTSGCEESLRIALQIIKNTDNKIWNSYIEDPTWGLAEVVFNQVFYNGKGIVKADLEEYFKEHFNSSSKSDFILKLNEKKIMDLYNKHSNPKYYSERYHDIIYTTDRYNNITYHDESLESESGYHFNKDAFFFVEDQVYTLKALLEPIYASSNIFYIGSFSKVFGAGYRLGYLIFNPIYKDMANLYRSHYISNSAIELINFMCTNEGKCILNEFRTRLKLCDSINKKLRIIPTVGSKSKDYNRRIYTTFHPDYISMENDSYFKLKKYQKIMNSLHFPIYNNINPEDYKIAKLSSGIKLIRIPVPKDKKKYDDIFTNYKYWFIPYDTLDNIIKDKKYQICKEVKKEAEKIIL